MDKKYTNTHTCIFIVRCAGLSGMAVDLLSIFERPQGLRLVAEQKKSLFNAL